MNLAWQEFYKTNSGSNLCDVELFLDRFEIICETEYKPPYFYWSVWQNKTNRFGQYEMGDGKPCMDRGEAKRKAVDRGMDILNDFLLYQEQIMGAR